MSVVKLLSKVFGPKCCICKKPIGFAYSPADQSEHYELMSRMDVEMVNVCECGASRHVQCSADRKQRLSKQNPKEQHQSFGKALHQWGTGGLEIDSVHKSLDDEVAGLECPKCGSFKFSVRFIIPS